MFPSGAWTGFWSYAEDGSDLAGTEHRLTLTFDGARMTGEGVDEVGAFAMTGTVAADRLEVSKRYSGQHEVTYSGRLGFRGCVVGRWRIGAAFGGRFLWAPPGADAAALAAAYADTLGG